MERKIRKACMGSKIEWVLVMMMMVLEYNCKWCCCFNCLMDERNVFLQIKADINYPNGSSLSTWSKEKTTNCCLWEGIECNPITRRVRSVNLDFNRERRLGKWYLNTSLFLLFEQLNTHSLTGDSLVGWVQNEDLGGATILCNLEELYLSNNKFDNRIIKSLSGLKRLKLLDLSANKLYGTIQINCDNLPTLKELDIRKNM
ncbi:Histone deacetylase [Bertholletia excelsa]